MNYVTYKSNGWSEIKNNFWLLMKMKVKIFFKEMKSINQRNENLLLYIIQKNTGIVERNSRDCSINF